MAFEGTLQEFTLMMHGPILEHPCIEVQQADTASRKVRIHLKTFGGKDYVMPYNATVALCIWKLDGNRVLNACEIEDQSTVIVELTTQAIACTGKQKAQLYICNGDGDIKSQAFYVIVPRAVYSEDAIKSSDEYGILRGLITDNQNIKNAEEERVTAEEERIQAEKERAASAEVMETATQTCMEVAEEARTFVRDKADAIIQTAIGTSIVAQDGSDDPVRGLRVFGRTTQDGTPTPDAPVPLVSVGDSGSVEIDVYGKNLLENTAVTGVVNNVTFTVNDDYSVTANGTANSNNPLFVINSLCALKAGTYAITGCPSGGGSTKYSIQVTDESATVLIAEDVGSGATFTLEEDQNVYVRIRIVGNTTVSYLTFYPMICFASVADNTYEPYAEQYLVLSTPNGLPGIPVTNASLANYTDADGQMWCSDEVDLERGVYVQRVKKIALKNYTFNLNTAWSEKNETLTIAYTKASQLPLIGPAIPLSDHLQGITYCIPTSLTAAFCMIEKRSNSAVLYVGIPKECGTTTEEFRAYMSTVDWTAVIPLATPIETPLTESELSAYQSLHSNYPVTTVLNDAGAHMEFSYNADPKNYIAAEHAKMEAAFDAKLAEIIALLPAETQAAMIENETTNLLNESEE